MNATSFPIAKFRCGRIVTTANALERLAREDILCGIGRHQAGDWGEVSDEDREQNEVALKEGTRLFSVYRDTNSITFWIITEADRSVTTVLLPADY